MAVLHPGCVARPASTLRTHMRKVKWLPNTKHKNQGGHELRTARAEAISFHGEAYEPHPAKNFWDATTSPLYASTLDHPEG